MALCFLLTNLIIITNCSHNINFLWLITGPQLVWLLLTAFYFVLEEMTAPCVCKRAKSLIPDEMFGSPLLRCIPEGKHCLTLWILALKWYRQNMSLEKIYFALWISRKLWKKEFLKSYIVLLRAELNCTIYASRMGWAGVASYVASQKSNVRFQKLIFPWFCLHS